MGGLLVRPPTGSGRSPRMVAANVYEKGCPVPPPTSLSRCRGTEAPHRSLVRRGAYAVALAVLAGSVAPMSAAAVVPNDPAFGLQYGLRLVDAPRAWDVQTGSASVLVASIDDGIDPAFADVAVNVVAGYDFGNRDSDPAQAESDHGSQTAALLAARGNNAVGIAGTAWTVGLMPLKVRTDGPGERFDLISPTAVADAVRHAGAHGARVANASFGLRAATTHAERDAIAAALAAAPNTLFVVSAGNTARDNDAQPRYPCNFDAPNLLCVAATDANDALWPSSNYGATSVDLAAPGTGVHVTTNRTNGPVDGTSYAAPLVSGAAALYFSHHPTATVADARRAILTGVDAKPTLTGRTASGGRLNIARTLTIPPRSAAPPEPPGPGPDEPPRPDTAPGTPAGPAPAPSPAPAPAAESTLPVAGAPPVSDTPAPTVVGTASSPRAAVIRVRSGQRLRDVIRRGLRMTIHAPTPRDVTLVAHFSGETRRRLGLRPERKTLVVRQASGLTTVRLPLGRGLQRLQRRGPVTAKVVVRVTDAAITAPRTRVFLVVLS